MSKLRKDSEMIDSDNPELTQEWFDQARPAADVLPPGVMAAAKRKPGRPPVDNPKEQVTLRLSSEVLAHFRASGKGWQTRIDEALKRVVR